MLQCIQQRQPFGILQRMLGRLVDSLHHRRPRRTNHRRQILQPDPPTLTQRGQRTQHITQLPHVARPGESQQGLTRRLINQHGFPTRFLGQQKVQ
ncbi:hypothetical protein D3C81_1757200 [compost metagenome]